MALLAHSVRTHSAIGPSTGDETCGWRAKQLVVGVVLQHRPWVRFKPRSDAGREGRAAESRRPGRARRVAGDVVCRKRQSVMDTRCRLLRFCGRTSMVRAAALAAAQRHLGSGSVCLSHPARHFHSLKSDGEPASWTSNRFFFPQRSLALQH